MSGGSDKGKGKKEERHSTRKGAGTIDKFTYKALGTGGGTKITLRGTPITISSDEEYEDVASPTMAVEPLSTPIGVPFDSATGKGKRFKWADYEEEDLYVRDVLGGLAVVAPTPPRQPEVYLTGDHVVPDVGLGTTVVEPPMSAVAAGTQPPIPPKVLGIVGLNTTAVGPPIPEVAPPIPQADVYLIDVSGSSAVAAGGSAVAAGGSAVAADDPNSGDLEMELVFDDPNSPDFEMELTFDYNTDK